MKQTADALQAEIVLLPNFPAEIVPEGTSAEDNLVVKLVENYTPLPAEALTRTRAVTAELSAVNALSTSMPAPTGSMEENASLNSTLSNLRIMPETPP